MRDFHGWRKMFGVATPAVNTCVQPEYDALRPAGVTNHIARIPVGDLAIRTDEDFARGLDVIFEGLDGTVRELMSCRPDHLILGISALSVWGGSARSSDDLKRKLSDAGGGIGVTLATDAIVAALRAHGVQRRIAIVEPYFPVIQPRLESYFTEAGFEVVRFNHMQGGQFSGYTRTTARAMIEELIRIDSPDVEALVQFGANLPMAAIADEAERWLNKPVIAVNTATYWHALRSTGILDQRQGCTQLFSRF